MRNIVNVLFPIETINRELDTRLVLAVMASRPGYRFFLGQHDVVARLARFIHGGLFVGNRVVNMEMPFEKGARYRDLKRNGFGVVFLDEEGGIYPGDRETWRRNLLTRLDATLFDPEDYHCAWGRFQREVYVAEGARNAQRIYVTGHPRFDLYKPRYRFFFRHEVESIERRFKPFVLVNTNLTLANNPMGLDDTFSRRHRYDPEDASNRANWVSNWAHNARLIAHIVQLVTAISVRYPRLNVVLRPHPSEDVGSYAAIFRGVPNVHVVREGSVGTWLFSCEALIHNGCTTALEAYLAEKPVIAYQPVRDSRFDFALPNEFGVNCSNEEEVIDALGDPLSARRPLDRSYPATMPELLYNFEGDALAKFNDVMTLALEDVSKKEQRFDERAFGVDDAARRASATGRHIVRRFLPRRLRAYRAFAAMFYGLDPSVIDDKLNQLEKFFGKRVRRRYHHAELMSIEAA